MYAIYKDNKFTECVGNVEFSDTVFQTAESLTDEQRVEFDVYEVVDVYPKLPANHTYARECAYSIDDRVLTRTFGVRSFTSEEIAAAKSSKNAQINQWRAEANQSNFTYAGKKIACDALSRSDIDAVAGSVAMNNAFPAGFPNAWKATDNTLILIPDIATFKAMYNAMTHQGTINFGHSQALKSALAAATTIEQVNAITWGQ